jgi:hypothetical protein
MRQLTPQLIHLLLAVCFFLFLCMLLALEGLVVRGRGWGIR